MPQALQNFRKFFIDPPERHEILANDGTACR